MQIRNRVLLCLCLLGVMAGSGLDFLQVAPNRLVSGQGHALGYYLTGTRYLLLLPLAGFAYALWTQPGRGSQWLVIGCSALWLGGLCWLAGDVAGQLEAQGATLSRTVLGGAFWSLGLLGWLAGGDAISRLPDAASRPGRARLLAILPLLLPFGLLLGGQLSSLSLLKEYANRQEVFASALAQHLILVAGALLPTLLLGVPLGIWLFRRPGRQAPVLAVLNLIQTVPAIALFGLLIGPLAALANTWPWLAEHGITGVGTAPALIALTLYALLPTTQGVLAGLALVPAKAREAARAMGMTPWQRFWQLEVPLALPVLLAGLRLTSIQLIGLAMLAALIGAGGLGTLVFQGLSSSALDLVLLGVIPVVALTLAADALFKTLDSTLTATKA